MCTKTRRYLRTAHTGAQEEVITGRTAVSETKNHNTNVRDICKNLTDDPVRWMMMQIHNCNSIQL